MTPLKSISDSTLEFRKNIRDGRIFALTLAAGFAVIALLAMRKSRDAIALAAVALAAISLFAALLVPGRLGPIRKAWMKIGEAIGYVTTPIFMMLAYYLFLTPLAIMKRLTARRPPDTDSSWYKRPPLPPRQRMERQF